MNTERWQQAKEIFSSALQLEPGEREEFLKRACFDDLALLEEVRSLLSYQVAAATTIASGNCAEGAPQITDAWEGRRLGSYELLHEIGRGGMAAVYLAVRADDQYRKHVAIKLIDRALVSDEVVHRFRNERQTLALLDHPNIVKLLDGGTTADGLLYLVMDYVEGAPIDAYCDAHRLTIEERLQLFRKVCSAVQYAHQNLVIHRDLKPANILVGADGTPKLLDFGIAKLLNPEFLAEASMTRAALHPMTPEYASPEQFRGEPITTATDVYSVGVVLYELLTGSLPYRTQHSTVAELGRAICTEEPTRPSTLVRDAEQQKSQEGSASTTAGGSDSVSIARGETTLDKLGQRLSGDLDNILLMALRKEPQRRYSSTEQFSEDLRRHLEGLPVIARRPTLGYRAGKFLRRNRAPVAAAIVIVAVLIGAVIVTAYEARVASRERAVAERRFNDVRQLADSFLFDFDGAIKNLRGSTPARKLVVTEALQYLNRLTAESRGDPSLQKDLAKAYIRVGDIQGNPYMANLGDLRGAMDSYRKAQGIALALSRAEPGDADASHLLARSYSHIATVELFLGNPREAADNLQQAAMLLEPLAYSRGADADVKVQLVDTYTSLGDAYGHGSVVNLGQPEMSLEYFRKALSLAESTLSADPTNQAVQRRIAIAESKIGDVLLGQHDLNAAVKHHRKSLAEFASIASRNAADAVAQRELSVAQGRLAASLWQGGDRGESLDLRRKALAISQDLYSADPTNMQAKFGLASDLRDLSDALAANGDLPGAVADFRRAIELVQQISDADPDNLECKAQLAEGLVSFGQLLARAGQMQEAGRATAHGLEIQATLAEGPNATRDQILTYASFLLNCQPPQLRRPSTALRFAQRAAQLSPNDPQVLDLLAAAYFGSGNAKEAVRTENQALALLAAHPSESSLETQKQFALNLGKFKRETSPK